MSPDALGAGVVAAGLVCGGIVAARARAPREGLRCLLDFLLAAGLLHLVGPRTPTALLVAAATLVVRQLAGRGLSRASASRRAPGPGSG